MSVRGVVLLTLAVGSGLIAGLPLPSRADEDGLRFPLPQAPKGREIVLGSVGMDSRVGTSRWKAMPEDPYRFWIPADRAAPKVPGFMVRIPFGGASAK